MVVIYVKYSRFDCTDYTHNIDCGELSEQIQDLPNIIQVLIWREVTKAFGKLLAHQGIFVYLLLARCALLFTSYEMLPSL